MDQRAVMAVLVEPTRYRIVELLADAPRTVSEVADALGALQPQTTKHLQALAAVELITVHRLGRRRVAALRRDTLRELVAWLDGLTVEHPSESVLDKYVEAIAAEQDRVATGAPGDRTIRVSCEVPASVDTSWRLWTTAKGIRRWWAPEHFTVARCVVRPVPGGALRIVLREADGAEHTAIGTYLEIRRHEELRFELSPLGIDGTPLFAATHVVSFVASPASTTITMTIAISQVQPEAIAALAGLEIGWHQTFDRLAAHLANAKPEVS